MNKLPLIEAKKKKNKLCKNIFSSEAEDDQRKNNIQEIIMIWRLIIIQKNK